MGVMAREVMALSLVFIQSLRLGFSGHVCPCGQLIYIVLRHCQNVNLQTRRKKKKS